MEQLSQQISTTAQQRKWKSTCVGGMKNSRCHFVRPHEFRIVEKKLMKQ